MKNRRIGRGCLAALALAACLLAAPPSWSLATLDEPVAEPRGDGAVKPPAFDEFIVIPLRVHVLTATDLPEVECKLSDEDVRRIVGKVNGVIWHQAGVHFRLESIRREPAARQDDFRRIRDLVGGLPPIDLYPILRPVPQAEPAKDAPPGEDAPAENPCPPPVTPADPATAGADTAKKPEGDAEEFQGLHVYYVHDLGSNGVYFGGDFSFVKETSSLRPVDGGIDEPIPRVTAHELGHALGLRHRQNWTNLMQSGTTGTLLDAAEVATARERAGRLAGAAKVAALRERAAAAEKSGDRDGASELWAVLAEIPGDGAAEAARHRGRLRPPK